MSLVLWGIIGILIGCAVAPSLVRWLDRRESNWP